MFRIALWLFLLGCSSSSPKNKEESQSAAAASSNKSQQESEEEKRKRESIETMNEGIEAVGVGDWTTAVSLLQKAAEIDSKNHHAWHALGQVQEQRKDYPAAVAAYEKAASHNETDANYHYHLGKALWMRAESGDIEKARQSLEKAIELDAELHNAHYYLGLVHEREGHAVKAAQSWSTAATLMPSFGRPFVHLGQLYLRWRKVDEAIAVLRLGTAKVEDPEDLTNLHYYLGIAYGLRLHWAEAISHYTKALDAQAGNIDALRQRGFAYAESGQADHAKADLKQFLAMGGGGRAYELQAVNQKLLQLAQGGSVGARTDAPANGERPPEPTELPAVPTFRVPEIINGAHSVEEMLVAGQPHLDTELKVRGTITWIYNCADAIRTPGMSDKEVKEILSFQPERCSLPHFHLAAKSSDTSIDSISVVEVPRPIRPDEKKGLPKEMVDSWPEVPKLKVGDEVVVHGTWARTSPRGFADSNGLLVYKSVEHIE